MLSPLVTHKFAPELEAEIARAIADLRAGIEPAMDITGKTEVEVKTSLLGVLRAEESARRIELNGMPLADRAGYKLVETVAAVRLMAQLAAELGI